MSSVVCAVRTDTGKRARFIINSVKPVKRAIRSEFGPQITLVITDVFSFCNPRWTSSLQRLKLLQS